MSQKQEALFIFGAGGFGREVQELVRQINLVTPRWDLRGFFDDGEAQGKLVNGVPVVGSMEALNARHESVNIVFAVGDAALKKSLSAAVKNPQVKYPQLIHPAASISDLRYSKIGEGCIIFPGCILSANVTLGRHVALHMACTIGHDVQLGDCCSLMPGVHVSGEVQIGEAAYIGTGAQVIQQLTIGGHSIIGAGAVVNESIPAHCTAVGVPARAIKFHHQVA